MASWFHRLAPNILKSSKRTNIPQGVWLKCPSCNQTIYSKELEKNYKVCVNCDYHFRLNAWERIEMISDTGTFREINQHIKTADPLKFTDTKKYKDRIKASLAKCDTNEAIVTGIGKIHGKSIALGVFNFPFMGGSMGAVVGEKITLLMEEGLKKRIPVILVTASGGARMQEGILSLMQMGKTSAMVNKLNEKSIPYITVLTDPTTGGVTASFAMLGDVIVAEPKALIGFAGPRVIKETIKQDLPEGFQRAEFLLKNGSIDRVIHRSELKDQLGLILSYTHS